MVRVLLVSAHCPACGAPAQVDPSAGSVTCAHCQRVFAAAGPDGAPAAPPGPGVGAWGPIHLAPAARPRRTVATILLVALLATGLVLGVAAALFAATTGAQRGVLRRGRAGTRVPPTAAPKSLGPACARAVRCCKAVQPGSAACDTMGMLDEAECGRQAATFAEAARALGKGCD